MQKRYLMNIHTGSVDTEESWLAENSEEDVMSLVEVGLADGSDVPDDFNPCQSDRFDWVAI